MDLSASLNLRELSRLTRTLMFDLFSASAALALRNKWKGMWLEPNAAAIPFSMWRFFSTLNVMIAVFCHSLEPTICSCWESLQVGKHLCMDHSSFSTTSVFKAALVNQEVVSWVLMRSVLYTMGGRGSFLSLPPLSGSTGGNKILHKQIEQQLLL